MYSKSFIHLSCVGYVNLRKLSWTMSSWAKKLLLSISCGYHLCLSLLWIFSLFSAITEKSSLSLFRSVCLTLITVSWQVLAHWVVDRPMSASSAWISFESLTHNPHPSTSHLSSTPKPCSLSLSLSYRTLSPTANLPGILPLSPTWSTRLCPVEVCHCPVIKTRTFLFSPSCLCAMSSRISDKCSQCFNCSYGKDCY